MKRIAVGVLSLGMLAATSARANYHDTVQGAATRPDYRGYDHTRYMQSGQEGNYAPQSYWEQGKMRPVDQRGYDHQRFEGGFEDRTTGGKWIGARRRRGPYFSHAGREYRYGGVRARRGDRNGWFSRRSAYDGPGMGGQADLSEQQY